MNKDIKLDTRKGEHIGRLDAAEQEDFSQCNMADSTVFGIIKECLFQHTDMTDADVTRVTFDSCLFAFCDMTEMNASQAHFVNCEFIGCYMRDAKFVDAKFDLCTLTACMAMYADFDDACFSKGVISGNFMHSRWEGASLTEINFDKILLAGSKGFPT